MKTIIAGTSSLNNYQDVLKAIKDSGFNITEVVCGMAKGPDTFGEMYAKANHIPVVYFPADWNSHGRAAGPIRNKEMGDYSEALIAIWDGVSKGTKNMIDYALKKRLKVYVKVVGSNGVMEFV